LSGILKTRKQRFWEHPVSKTFCFLVIWNTGQWGKPQNPSASESYIALPEPFRTKKSVRFEVFTAVTMKNGVFWDVTMCGSCKIRRFGGT
jgi:hypothetical protein